MAAPGQNRRIISEVSRLRDMATGNETKFLLDRSPVDDPSSNVILGRILPKSKIYNEAAYQIEIALPAGYPFEAPKVRFITQIYHPNVDFDFNVDGHPDPNRRGQICIDIINAGDGYKPTTRLSDIVIAVTNLIDNPNLEHALNAEIAAEYSNNRATFDNKALAMVKRHGLLRS